MSKAEEEQNIDATWYRHGTVPDQLAADGQPQGANVLANSPPDVLHS
jgi:hypothetical protein